MYLLLYTDFMMHCRMNEESISHWIHKDLLWTFLLFCLQILIQSVMETMVPKLVAEDIPLLNSLLSDVFPGIQYTQDEKTRLREEIAKVCAEMYLVYACGEESGAAWVDKVGHTLTGFKMLSVRTFFQVYEVGIVNRWLYMNLSLKMTSPQFLVFILIVEYCRVCIWISGAATVPNCADPPRSDDGGT